MRRVGIAASAAVAFITLSAHAAEPVHKTDGIALSGYDAVAYFTDGKPVKGSSSFEHSWNGATWRFASAAHRDAFVAAPEKYAPQYGGYCAWAVSKNYTYAADPEAWKIVDGKLYLNYDKSVREVWEKEIPAAIARADRNWPAVLSVPEK